MQKEGVTIGSFVSPLLTEIYLDFLDSAMNDGLERISSESCVVQTYVDDIVVCAFQTGVEEKLNILLRLSASQLTFTVE